MQLRRTGDQNFFNVWHLWYGQVRRLPKGFEMEIYETVKVYSFRIFDIEIGAMSHATYKASRETIAASPGGEVLEGTEQEVAFGQLDRDGRYRRLATGWGELS